MSTSSLRPGATTPSRERNTQTVESLAEQVARLQLERQQLREGGADRDRLEENRLALVRCNLALAHALIARYLPASA